MWGTQDIKAMGDMGNVGTYGTWGTQGAMGGQLAYGGHVVTQQTQGTQSHTPPT